MIFLSSASAGNLSLQYVNFMYCIVSVGVGAGVREDRGGNVVGFVGGCVK